jgi:hypothetical protein
VIIVALRVDRDRAARALREYRQRILVRPVIDAEHDHRAYVRPQHARIGAAFRMSREPVHVAMCAGVEEAAEMLRGIRDRTRIGDADAIESERARFMDKRCLQIGGRKLEGCVQKSRST